MGYEKQWKQSRHREQGRPTLNGSKMVADRGEGTKTIWIAGSSKKGLGTADASGQRLKC